MDVGSINAATAQNAQARQSLSGNFDTFLRLLTTQLQYQDPLEPLDATKFTEQLVSYSQVEQQINTNANLEALIAMQRSAAGANAVGYLGKTALTQGDASSLDAGGASWRYALPADAATVQLRITDANGNVVRTLAGSTTLGAHDFTWDGQNSGGVAMPAGAYRLVVVAKDASGADMPYSVWGLGTVKELDMSGLEPLLTIGTRKVSLSQIAGLKN
jgi:flagellar basal-body rod modification protein FlgD